MWRSTQPRSPRVCEFLTFVDDLPSRDGNALRWPGTREHTAPALQCYVSTHRANRSVLKEAPNVGASGTTLVGSCSTTVPRCGRDAILLGWPRDTWRVGLSVLCNEPITMAAETLRAAANAVSSIGQWRSVKRVFGGPDDGGCPANGHGLGSARERVAGQ